MGTKRVVGGLIVLAGISACGELTSGTLGFGPANTTQTFAWGPVPGAAAYQVTVNLDRALSAPVGTSGFVTTTSLDASQLTWKRGEPQSQRPYFWVMRAYDGTSTASRLLTATDPRQIVFGLDQNGSGGLELGFSGPTPSPAIAPSPGPLASPTATPTAEPAASGAASPVPSPSAT